MRVFRGIAAPKRRLLNLATAGSSAALLFFLALWAVGNFLTIEAVIRKPAYFIQVGNVCGQIYIFAQHSEYIRHPIDCTFVAKKPYQGDSLTIAQRLHANFPLWSRTGNEYVAFTFIPLWPICLAAAALPALRHLARRRAAVAPNCCPSCGYDLRATPLRCPECGTSHGPPPALAPPAQAVA